MDWRGFLKRLHSFPANAFRILPPAPTDRIDAAERTLGALPPVLRAMLAEFNGAEVFIDAAPFATIFGMSGAAPPATLEWAPEWHIDTFTHQWRSHPDRKEDWAIAMMNYGGLIILGKDGLVREWDTNESGWSAGSYSVQEWTDCLLEEGAAYLDQE